MSPLHGFLVDACVCSLKLLERENMRAGVELAQGLGFIPSILRKRERNRERERE
jgi:hypothetical protein